ncbi:MAG: peptidase M48 [Zetaproteobacteria bacterium CG1_02_49_23]|nr:MAG: peptidase M48 [Zetaproteobacteria bacterium CG1_02_49_23]
MKRYSISLALMLTLALSACATNPVTGKKELSLISEQQELAMGAQQYAPLRQSQGGDYNVDPALTSYVSEIGQRLAKVSDRQLPYEFKVLNNGVPNAWALPGGKIVVNRGLLTELHNEAELAAVLGHEITHAAARHTAHNMSRGMVLQGAVIGATIATQQKDYGHVAQLGANIGAQMLNQRFSRDAERESDYYGMLYMSRAGYDPQGAVGLQETFVKLAEGQRQDWLQGLFASHPPSPERVQSNRQRLQELPAGGDLGAQRFNTKMAHLRQTKAAYDDYDKARASLDKGDVKRATQLVQRAIKIEPKEGHFQALYGDIHTKQNHSKQAMQAYNRAIDLNANFFYYYLQRGKLEQQKKNFSKAEADFKKSAAMLPTADAYYGLGVIARNSNRMAEARQYFSSVAQSNSELGKIAYGDLVDIDLPANPAQYLSVKNGILPDNRAVIQLNNATPRAVNNIMVSIQFVDAAGQLRRINRAVPGVLAAGKNTVVDLGLGVLTQQQLAAMQVTVIRASVAAR